MLLLLLPFIGCSRHAFLSLVHPIGAQCSAHETRHSNCMIVLLLLLVLLPFFEAAMEALPPHASAHCSTSVPVFTFRATTATGPSGPSRAPVNRGTRPFHGHVENRSPSRSQANVCKDGFITRTPLLKESCCLHNGAEETAAIDSLKSRCSSPSIFFSIRRSRSKYATFSYSVSAHSQYLLDAPSRRLCRASREVCCIIVLCRST